MFFPKYLIISIIHGFKYFIRYIKHWLGFFVKITVRHKWRWCFNISRSFISNEFWWKLVCYIFLFFIFFLKLFMVFIVYLVGSIINGFKYFIILIKLGLGYGSRLKILYKLWWCCDNSGSFSIWSGFIAGDRLCVCGWIHI